MSKLSWQVSLANVITDFAELCEILQLNPEAFKNISAIKDFPLRVPREFLARMQKGNPNDPLLTQILPIAQEMQLTPGYTHDPLQEKSANAMPGLLHKYKSRVLLLLAGGCAINCRYCFRRHFAYNENAPGKKGWDDVLNYIAADSSITEVIYSGGDPLLLKDEALTQLTEKIAAIPHVTTLRVHTRLPIIIPSRVTEKMLYWLTSTPLKPVVVMHCNHPNEIDTEVAQAIQRLRNVGVTVLNQAVLLKGINDEAEILIALSRRLFEVGVLPYYLHILDAVQGAAHFAISIPQAQRLMGEVAAQLPGYLVPKLVQEKPGMSGKMLLIPEVSA